MAYSTAQVAPSSIAVVHPSICHPAPRAAKHTTSKPVRAPRWCHAAVAGTGAKDLATHIATDACGAQASTPGPSGDRPHCSAAMRGMGITGACRRGCSPKRGPSLWRAKTASRTPADGDATDGDCRA
jgi:hypothetical protein